MPGPLPPPMVAVCGWKNSGKTTAVEQIVAELVDRGFSVGTIKHCHDGFDLDRPGKDSFRHRQAGAARTLLVGPDEMALIQDLKGPFDPLAAAQRFFSGFDIMLLEGFHWLALPRIEVCDETGRNRPAGEGGPRIVRLSHRFGHEEIVQVCDRLEDVVKAGHEAKSSA